MIVTFRRQVRPVRRQRNATGRRLFLERLEDRTLLSATVVRVDTLQDLVDPSDGRTSLREAVIQANSTPGDFEIRLPPGTHRLSIQGAFESQARSGDLNILANYPQSAVTIVGAGAERTTIDASGLGDRILQVWAGATLHVEGLTLTGGWAPVLDPGGGILNLGTLTIRDSAITGNRAFERGGGIGIHSLDGARPTTLSVINSTVSGNSAAYGGGISSIDGVVTLSNTTVSGNAAQSGGGIFTGSWGRGTPALTVRESILSNNQASDYGGGIAAAGQVTITDSTVSQNSSEWFGGGIWNIATLTISNSTISGNSSRYDGSISNSGALTVTATSIFNNSGGGVSNSGTSVVTDSSIRDNSEGGISNSGTMTVTGSIISRNSAVVGGGIWNLGTLTVIHSTISDNSAEWWGGGANNSLGAAMHVLSSTISNNAAEDRGGGISNAGTLVLLNSTVSGNAARENAGIGNRPGGSAAIGHSTIVGNAATTAAAGISNEAGLVLHHTIVAGNFVGTLGESLAPGDLQAHVSLDPSSSYNLIGDAGSAGGLLHGDNGNLVGQAGSGTIDLAAILDVSLRDNGGPTFTHALLPGSPAVEAGDPDFDPNDFVPALVYDQRGAGFDRLRGGRIDIGAFESYRKPWHNDANPFDVDGQGGAQPLDALTLINFINLHGSLRLPDPPAGGMSPPPYVDVNDDGYAAASDVLMLINHLNARSAGPLAGEAVGSPRARLAGFPEYAVILSAPGALPPAPQGTGDSTTAADAAQPAGSPVSGTLRTSGPLATPRDRFRGAAFDPTWNWIGGAVFNLEDALPAIAEEIQCDSWT